MNTEVTSTDQRHPHSPTAHNPSNRRLRRSTVLVAVAALLGSVLAFLSPAAAGAGTNGVAYVNFAPNPYYCDQRSIPTCYPDHGIGKSNTLYVHQDLVDGEYRFTDVTGTSMDPDEVWMQTTFSTQCRSRFRLNWAGMDPGSVDGEGDNINASGSGGNGLQWPQPVNQDNRTIPERNIALHQSLDNVLAQWDVTIDDILESGEEGVAQAIAEGATPQDARSTARYLNRHYNVEASVGCRQTSGLYSWMGNTEWRQVARGMPIQIVFLGAGMEPGDEDDDDWRDIEIPDNPTPPEPVSEDLSAGFAVTQADLLAIEDEADACTLHLSGVVQTNGPGEVTYRFVDELGVKSQQFSTQVDGTQVAFLDHEIQLDPIVVDTGLEGVGGEPDQLVADEGEGEVDGFAHSEGDNVQGYFTIEVSAPHAFESNIASYNVDGCTTAPVDPGTGQTGTRDPGTQEIDTGDQEMQLGTQPKTRSGLGG